MDFNQTSSQYHIVLDIYEGDEATTRLDAAMVSSDPPDLLDISSLSFSKYFQKQALADLSPYLNQSEVLNREDLRAGTEESALCITASSRHKKAAWEFVEFFLSQDLDLFLMNAFPTRLETLLDLIEEEATPGFSSC